MTKDQLQDVRDDIAFLRALAQEGSQVPMLGGGISIAAGLIFALASVGHWLIAQKILVVSDWAYLVNWLGAGAIFGVVATLLIRRTSRQPGATSAVNTATGAAWSGVGMSIFVMWLGMMAIMFVTKNSAVFAVFPVLILALYGAAWSVAADMSRRGWLRVVSWGSYVGAVLMGLLTTSPYQMLAYAAALVLLAVVPGIILVRQEPADTI